MLSFLLNLCIDITFGPIVDAVLSSFTFTVCSNILNDGELLWSMDD